MSYEDIINLPHHISEKRARMPQQNRAAQFAPFSALNGHEEAIVETARYTDPFSEWDEEYKAALNLRLTEALAQKRTVSITFYVPDPRKAGGSYRTVCGIIKRVEESNRLLYMEDKTCIPLDHLTDIKPDSD